MGRLTRGSLWSKLTGRYVQLARMDGERPAMEEIEGVRVVELGVIAVHFSIQVMIALVFILAVGSHRTIVG